jgi:prepilin-type N-terminal cleavage/methylation domain-containing protein
MTRRTPVQRIAAGFTLVELLVVIAIIGTLVGLLLPAVQMARESARRSKCMNNVKQTALAFHSHHDANNRLPPARAGDNSNSSTTHAWPVRLLPFVEEMSLYDKFTGGASGPGRFGIKSLRDTTVMNQAVLTTVISMWNCPTLGRSGESLYTSYNVPGGTSPSTGRYGWCGDYAVNFGSSVASVTDGPFDLQMNQNGLRFKDITDGLSKTVFGGEKHLPRNKQGVFSSSDPWDNTFYSAAYTGGQYTNCRKAGAIGLAQGPDDITANYQYFGSYHPDTVVMFFGDGAVNSMSTSIAGSVLEQLGTRAGGESIDAY